MKTITKMTALLAIMLLICSCSIKRPPNEYTALRMATTVDHGSIERTDVNGLMLDTIGSSGAPKIVLGKINNSQIFLPKLKCTTYYQVDGDKKDRTECEEITPVTVEAKIDGAGAYAGDIIATGAACEYESAYVGTGGDMTTVWIEGIKASVENSKMGTVEKQSWYDLLNKLAEKLITIKSGGTTP